MKVPAATLRTLFNTGDFYQRMQRGELQAQVQREKAAVLGNEPVTTQIVAYIDAAGVRVAVVHQYVRADGCLAASGLPDPKYVRVHETEYVWNGD